MHSQYSLFDATDTLRTHPLLPAHPPPLIELLRSSPGGLSAPLSLLASNVRRSEKLSARTRAGERGRSSRGGEADAEDVRGERDRRAGEAERDEVGVEVEEGTVGSRSWAWLCSCSEKAGELDLDGGDEPRSRTPSPSVTLEDDEEATLRALDSRVRGSRGSSSAATGALRGTSPPSAPLSPLFSPAAAAPAPAPAPARTCTGSPTPHARLTQLLHP